MICIITSNFTAQYGRLHFKMSVQSRVSMKAINQHITCSLCAGYLVDATTITECLHTFCKTCIVKYLQTCNSCPICTTVVHETQPLLNLRPDRTMQDIVYKLVPGLYKEERERREKFYLERGETDPNCRPPPMDPVDTSTEFSQNHFSRDEDLISLQIEPHVSVADYPSVQLQELTRKYMRISSRAAVHQLKWFLVHKLCVPALYDLDLVCDENILHKDSTLKFIWLSYWLKKSPPLLLHYKLKPRLV